MSKWCRKCRAIALRYCNIRADKSFSICLLAFVLSFKVAMFMFLYLATVCMSNIKSSFLQWSICHFLKGMIWKEALKKLLRGIDVFSEAYICEFVAVVIHWVQLKWECFGMITGFCHDHVKPKLENMMNHLMLQSNIGCRVFKKLWLSNGSALHLPPRLLMLKMLVPNFFCKH